MEFGHRLLDHGGVFRHAPCGRAAARPRQWPVVVPTADQVQELQRLLIARRLLTGEVDGRMGGMTRAAVKKAQLQLGLPADSYPTPDLIERLRAGR